MKSEPSVYSIDDLARDGSTAWDGVRNYQARNFMRDHMAEGDLVLYYHSNAEPMGVAGLAKVSKSSYPDATQFDARSKYFDPKATRATPRWFLVDVAFVEKLAAVLPLSALKEDAGLADMLVVQRGQRLSVQPVEKKHFSRVLRLSGAKFKLR